MVQVNNIQTHFKKEVFMNKLNTIRTSIPAFMKALFNKNTPASAKIVVLAAILYAVMPADLVADVVPFLGWFDDAVVMAILFTIAGKMIPDTVMDEKKDEIEDINYQEMD